MQNVEQTWVSLKMGNRPRKHAIPFYWGNWCFALLCWNGVSQKNSSGPIRSRWSPHVTTIGGEMAENLRNHQKAATYYGLSSELEAMAHWARWFIENGDFLWQIVKNYQREAKWVLFQCYFVPIKIGRWYYIPISYSCNYIVKGI
jgi:hypothetical protein